MYNGGSLNWEEYIMNGLKGWQAAIRSNFMTAKTNPKWHDVAVAHTYIGHISKMQELCLTLGYPMFCWNGRIYFTVDCYYSGFNMEDVD